MLCEVAHQRQGCAKATGGDRDARGKLLRAACASHEIAYKLPLAT